MAIDYARHKVPGKRLTHFASQSDIPSAVLYFDFKSFRSEEN